jgi:hypothetical protein
MTDLELSRFRLDQALREEADALRLASELVGSRSPVSQIEAAIRLAEAARARRVEVQRVMRLPAPPSPVPDDH